MALWGLFHQAEKNYHQHKTKAKAPTVHNIAQPTFFFLLVGSKKAY